MRKFLTMALAMVMAVCVALPAYAAGPSTEEPIDTAATEEKKEDAPTGVSPEGVTYWVSAPSESIPSATAALSEAGIATPAGATATVAYLQDIHADKLPLEMTFTIGGGDPNAKLYVMHWNGAIWELVAEGTGNWVHARFTSLSPVAVIRVTGVPATAGGRTVRTAPQTGETMTVTYIALVVMAMAGLVAMKARKKEM